MSISQGSKAAPRLATRRNAFAKSDYIITLMHRASQSARITVHYVPDRWILDAGAFAACCDAVAAQTHQAIEEAAHEILTDLNNDLVPRWICIKIETPTGGVLVEDRQPNWENNRLTDRVGPI